MTTRTAGKRGLLPIEHELHDQLKTAEDYGFVVPAPTFPIDKSGGITEFGMDGNGPDPTLTVNGGQPVGDCGVAAVPGHVNMTTAVLAGLELASYTLTSNQIVTLYFTYQAKLAGIAWRPPQDSTEWVAPAGLDNGVDLGSWLLWLFQQGIIDGFLAIKDLTQLEAHLAFFDAVVVGVSLNDQADQQFENGQPWDIGPGDEPDPSEGHAIQFLGVASPTGPYEWATWGAKQPSTAAWRNACVQQAFVVLSKPEAAAKNFPLAALAADLKALGGTAA